MNHCPQCQSILNANGACLNCQTTVQKGRSSICPTCGAQMLIQNGVNECQACKEQFLCNGDTLYLY